MLSRRLEVDHQSEMGYELIRGSTNDNDDEEEEEAFEEDEDEDEEEHLALANSPPPRLYTDLPYEADEDEFPPTSLVSRHTAILPSQTRLRTARIDDVPEVDMLLRKRARFSTPASRFEVEESSAAAAARQAGHTLAHRVDYGFIDTVDASI
ncbi:hypothetical protein Tco_1102542 [Tanacetum coccineum]